MSDPLRKLCFELLFIFSLCLSLFLALFFFSSMADAPLIVIFSFIDVGLIYTSLVFISGISTYLYDIAPLGGNVLKDYFLEIKVFFDFFPPHIDHCSNRAQCLRLFEQFFFTVFSLQSLSFGRFFPFCLLPLPCRFLLLLCCLFSGFLFNSLLLCKVFFFSIASLVQTGFIPRAPYSPKLPHPHPQTPSNQASFLSFSSYPKSCS